MPYVNPKIRKKLEQQETPANTPGCLNYQITKLIHNHIEEFGLNYRMINEVIGVLECAKLELYRMIAAPYENQKMLQNGRISKLDATVMTDG